MDYVGLRAIIEWNNYLSYRAEKEELIDALKTAFILFKLMGSSFSIHEKVTMVNDALLIKLSEILFGEKLQLSEDEKNIINKLADLLLIIRIENIVKFIAIKVTTRATKPLIEEPLKIIAEKQIEGIKYKGQLYSVKDLYYLIITFSELPKTVEETLDTYEVIVPFNILEPLIIDRNSETSYGALLLIYNKCSKKYI
ncbi:hypothetical protein [Vulcanisaeta sp. JCM 16159]|uniref:hypothetical protein n=1 Tax=Vulcanisaeta sp. JCM 16159 TaxID=1295371 RepID=UPI0006D28B94|nr:hypothetical protein [Vulcanisaeta sp. JCM 16159]